jgi:hypothetical protein
MIIQECAMPPTISRPNPDEYAPYTADYMRLVPDGDILAILAGQLPALDGLLGGLSDEQALGRFAPGEWSIKEVVGHLIDAERIFSYRLLALSRGERANLPGFEQDDYVRAAAFDARSFADLREELRLLRRANLLAYRTITPEVAMRRGTANGHPFSVRALIYLLAGHFDYHLRDLREQYLPALG